MLHGMSSEMYCERVQCYVGMGHSLKISMREAGETNVNSKLGLHSECLIIFPHI